MVAREVIPVIFFIAHCCASSSVGSALPKGAIVFKKAAATFRGEGKPFDVVFYFKEMAFAGVTVRSDQEQEIARAETPDPPLRFLDGTGVYDVTGDGWPDIVLYTQVGGKTTEVQIYELEGRTLKKIGEWQGFGFRVVQLGRPVVAFTPRQYGALTNLYVWQDGQFRESSDQFPQFYAPEIEQQESFIYGQGSYPANIFSQACSLAAQGLVFGRKYDEAERTCRKAFEIVNSGERVVRAMSDSPPEQLYVERQQAARQIRGTLEQIDATRRKGSTRLAPPTKPSG